MKSLRIVMVLTIIGVISGALLSGVFAAVDPLIKENRRRAINKAVKVVVPGVESVRVDKIGTKTIYRGTDGSGRIIGNAFVGEFAGFQGKISMMIGTDPDFERILGIDILENIETPGLGNKITENSFREQFAGLSGRQSVTLVKNQAADRSKNQVETITGATISSQAVVDGVSREMAKVRKAAGLR